MSACRFRNLISSLYAKKESCHKTHAHLLSLSVWVHTTIHNEVAIFARSRMDGWWVQNVQPLSMELPRSCQLLQRRGEKQDPMSSELTTTSLCKCQAASNVKTTNNNRNDDGKAIQRFLCEGGCQQVVCNQSGPNHRACWFRRCHYCQKVVCEQHCTPPKAWRYPHERQTKNDFFTQPVKCCCNKHLVCRDCAHRAFFEDCFFQPCDRCSNILCQRKCKNRGGFMNCLLVCQLCYRSW